MSEFRYSRGEAAATGLSLGSAVTPRSSQGVGKLGRGVWVVSKILSCSPRNLGNDPNWLIFLRWVESKPPSRYIDSKFGSADVQEPSMRRRLKSFQKTLTPSDWGRRIRDPKVWVFFAGCFLLEFFLSPTPKRICCIFSRFIYIFFSKHLTNIVENFSRGLIFFDLQKPYILAPLKKKLSKDP